jgi:hypothetical protein
VVTFIAAFVCLGIAFGGSDSGDMSSGEVHTYTVLFFVFLGLFFASLVFTLAYEIRRGVQEVKGQRETRGWVRIMVAVFGFVAILVLARWYVTGGW